MIFTPITFCLPNVSNNENNNQENKLIAPQANNAHNELHTTLANLKLLTTINLTDSLNDTMKDNNTKLTDEINKIHYENLRQQSIYNPIIASDPYTEIINKINTGIITINVGLILVALFLEYKDERLASIPFTILGAATIQMAHYSKYIFPIGIMLTALNLTCTHGFLQKLKNYRDGDLYILREQLFTFPRLTITEEDPLHNDNKIIHNTPHLDDNINETPEITKLESTPEETFKIPCKNIYEATEKTIAFYDAMGYKDKLAWRKKYNWPKLAISSL